MVHGIEATQDFYRELFGWEFVPGPRQLGPYVRALLGGREVAGIGQLPPDRDLRTAWTTYLATGDADETAESIRSCGGTVAVGPLDAGEAGRLVICSDPAGAVFGVWEAEAHHGTALAGPPGTPVWNELLTYETATVGKFYRSVFGYEVEPVVSTDFDYATLHVDGRPVASLHGVGEELARDRGPHWMTYFEVDDADAAARLVGELGGLVLRPPRDGTAGRLALVADPEGAVFTLVRSRSR
ncbi:VOC family protein [Streptomyces roseolus]|uniref:VOC family protein n=1 Tax=Streptomyces roseolus TaxID=67358 RepID=UPI0033C8AB4E